MKLIDADENRENFMETVYEILADEPDNIKANLIIDAFDSMEVAYDVDAVVRELEARYEWQADIFHGTLNYDALGQMRAYDNAIRIVERGGRNEV